MMANLHSMIIPRDRLHATEIVAEGRFSKVFLAFLADPRSDLRETVALKMLKSEYVEAETIDLYLREAETTTNFQHVNVLRVIGVSAEDNGRPLIVQPFMSNGDLRTYITNPRMDMTVLHLLQLGLQVVRGMVYLSTLPVVHCHLRAKSCMVNSRGIVKVADFGLTRELIVRDHHYETRNDLTHVMRWMAPETLEAHIFSTMSDIWSFGVLLWELMTRGAPPYDQVKDVEILNYILSGGVLCQPTFCPEEIYGLMGNCWSLAPLQRPNFKVVEETIYRIVHSAHRGSQTSSSAFYANLITPPNAFDACSLQDLPLAD